MKPENREPVMIHGYALRRDQVHMLLMNVDLDSQDREPLEQWLRDRGIDYAIIYPNRIELK